MSLIDIPRLTRFAANMKEWVNERLATVSSGIASATGAAWAQKTMESKRDMIYTATSTDGKAYTVTVPGVTELYAGLQITVQLNRSTSTVTPTIDVNGLGAKGIRQPLNSNNVATTTATLNTWISSACPTTLTYTGSLWKTDYPRMSANNFYGTVGVDKGGTGATTAEAARTNLGAASQADVEALIARVSALEGN